MVTVILIFATYVVTLILNESDGPGNVFARLRSLKAFSVLRCYLCLSVYIGAIFALYSANSLLEWLTTSLALAGGAVFLQRLEL